MNKLFTILIFNLSFIIISPSFAQWTSGGTRLSYATGDQHRPVVSATHSGVSYITWVGTDSSSSGYYGNIYLNGLDAQGNILAGLPSHGIAVTSLGNQWAPVIITSEDDNPILAWQGYLTANSQLKIFTQKFSNAGTPLWNGGNPIPITTNLTNMDQYPIIISDRHNGLYVTWYRFDSAGTAIYAQHIDSTGNIAKGWNPAGAIVSNTSSRAYYPRIVLSNDESAIYIMYTIGPAGGSSLLLNKLNTSDGSPASGWIRSGLLLSPGPEIYPTVADEQSLFCDNLDNVVAFWSETRYTDNGENYMQQISPAGSIMLNGYGKYLTGKNNGNGTMHLMACKDAEGNFLIADADYSNNSNAEALKVAANGKIIWRTITSNGTSEYPKPVTDGHGGMYLFYKNSSVSPPRLQALAIDSLGNFYKGWTVTGANFGNCNQYDPFFPQYDFYPVATKPGSAVVSWNRIDNTSFNVYVCNLRHDGTECDFDYTSITEKSPAANNNISVFPNPFNTIINIQQYVINLKSKIQNLEFRLYDITGKEILNEKLNSLNTELQTPNLSNGIYFYNITDDQTSVKRGKLIKE